MKLQPKQLSMVIQVSKDLIPYIEREKSLARSLTERLDEAVDKQDYRDWRTEQGMANCYFKESLFKK